MEKYTTLSNNIQMPILGIGVYQIPKEETERVVHDALEVGYRLVDTAALYGNEREVGKAIKNSGIVREEVFVTTKLHPLRFFGVEQVFHTSLKTLGMDYIDLYLIHWPFLRTQAIWESLEKLYEQKLVKAIGVSNFRIKDLADIIKTASVIPMVNQVEFHPFLYQEKMLPYCKSKHITVQAHSPLTHGKRIQDPIISKIATSYSKSPAQILIRWSMQHGVTVIPKTSHKSRLLENIDVFDFTIGDEDMRTLDRLNEKYHVAGLSKIVGDDEHIK